MRSTIGIGFLFLGQVYAQPAAWGTRTGRDGWSNCAPQFASMGEPPWNESVNYLENDLVWNRDPSYTRLRDAHDHAYTNEDHDLLLDYYRPHDTLFNRQGADFPLYIYLHGGGLQVGDRNGVHNTAKKLGRKMSQEGFVAASIQYREIGGTANPFSVGDQAAHPDLHLDDMDAAKHLLPTLDMRMAIYFFTSRPGQYKIADDDIFIGGCSAGAVVSLWAGFLSYAQFGNDQTGTVGNIQGVFVFSPGVQVEGDNSWVTTAGTHQECDGACKSKHDYWTRWHKVPSLMAVVGDDGGAGNDHHKEMAFVWEQKPTIEQHTGTVFLHVIGGGHSPIHPWDEFGYHNAGSAISGPQRAPWGPVNEPYWCTISIWLLNSYADADYHFHGHRGDYGKKARGGGHRRLTAGSWRRTMKELEKKDIFV